MFSTSGRNLVSEEREYWLVQSIPQEWTLLTKNRNTVIVCWSRKGWKVVGDSHLSFAALERVGQWTTPIEPNPTHTKQPVAGMGNSINNLGLSQHNNEESKCYCGVWTPCVEVGKLNMESWVSVLGKIKKLKLKLRQGKKKISTEDMEIPGTRVQEATKVLLKETACHRSVLPSDTPFQDNFSDWEDGLPLSCFLMAWCLPQLCYTSLTTPRLYWKVA